MEIKCKLTDREKEIKQSRERYWEQFKKDKKRIVKLAKEFEPYDFGFLVDLVFACVDTMIERYSHEELFFSDVSEEPFLSEYKDLLRVLKELKFYEQQYREELDNKLTPEQEKILKAEGLKVGQDKDSDFFWYNERTSLRLYFTKLGDIITELWD